jgi:transcriptional regulator with XRE-family HTH domain
MTKDAQSEYPALETIRSIIARKIIEGRLAAGLTQEQLSKKTGIAVETLSRLESGKHKPQAATIAKIEKALGKL